MKKLWVLATGLLLLLGVFAYAQDSSQPVALLEYFDNPDGIQVIASDGTDLLPDFGMELLPGDKVITTTSVAELKLDPNGSLIKLATNTQFSVDSLQGRDGSDTNAFTLVAGKLKAVAAHTGNAQYQVRTQTAVCGVRGTIFGMDVEAGKTDAVLVTKGLVTFQNAAGQIIDVAAGQIADALAGTFQAIAATADQINQFFQGINEFVGQGMNPDQVPGNEPTPGTPSTGTSGEAGTGGTQAPSFMQPILDWLKNYLGMEIGTLTIDGETYSKAVIQPDFALGKLKIGLYLPIIYQSNLFDPSDWYHPNGNNEWSFGTDYNWQTDTLAGVGDLLSDILLKFRYIQYGEQRDPFYVSVGNLDNMTIGHGILMRDYANDYDFPAVRRLGVNTGLDLGGFGFEAVVNDLTDPQIFGGRIYFRPFKSQKLAFGVSSIVDISPASALGPDATGTGDPIFFNAAVDLDRPIIETDFLSIILFADTALMLPYYRETVPGLGNDPGFYFPAVYNADVGTTILDHLQNYGIAAGVFGKIFVVNYRLEFRDYNGTFRPTFYGANYDRLRGQYVLQLNSELANPTSVEPTVGIYGEAGFSIGDKFTIQAGYMWPWHADFTPSQDDLLHLQATVASGLIPKFDLHGSISYDRTKFIPTLLGEDANLTLFDANTVLRGELIYPIAPTLDIAVVVSTAAALNTNGTPKIDPNTNLPVIAPSVSIETRVHF